MSFEEKQNLFAANFFSFVQMEKSFQFSYPLSLPKVFDLIEI